jgi:hypothetical protein
MGPHQKGGRSLNTLNDPNTSAAVGSLVAGMAATYFLVILCIVAVGLFVNWKIASKAGYNGALSLLMLLPFANFVVLLIFALSEWPIERELKAWRAGTGGGYTPPPPPGSYVPQPYPPAQ